MKKINEIKPTFYWLIHPGALALYFSILIISVIPDYFEKYTAEIVEEEKISFQRKNFFYDLDNNGFSERVMVGYQRENSFDLVSIVLYDDHSDKIINQWNINGSILLRHKTVSGDFNHNKLPETYYVTRRNDSLFINVFEFFGKKKHLVKDRFFSKAGSFYGNNYDISFIGGKVFDINNDGFEEFVFVINSGFSKYPRKVFAFDIKNNKITSTPESATTFTEWLNFYDFNNDGVLDITGSIIAYNNIHYPLSHTDSSCWLKVINPVTMDYIFPPLRFDIGIGASVIPEFVKNENENYILLSTTPTQNSIIKKHQIYIIDSKGDILTKRDVNQRSFPFYHKQLNSAVIIKQAWEFFLANKNLDLELMKIDPINNSKLVSKSSFSSDIGGDSKLEYVFAGRDQLKRVQIIIFSQDFKHYIKLLLLGSSQNDLDIQLIENNDGKLMYVQADDMAYKVKYEENKYFWLKYPTYSVLYIFIFYFFFFLQKAQKSFVSQRYETEKQLMQHQMALSKKQMEPHFMLNMINNIGYMFSKEDKQNAMYYLGKFGSIMRRGLINSRASQITLEEELEFVEDYLILQKKLLDDELEFQIKIDENIEEELILIPHSIVYTFVENAIKHGLKPKEFDRKLYIRVEQAKKQIKINIQDNGIGRQKSKELDTTDTGKGMEIIKTIIKGYNSLHGGNIRYQVNDIFGEMGVCSGTRVEIWV